LICFLFQHHSSGLLLPWLASIEVNFEASMDTRPSFHSTLQHKITVALSGVTPTQQQGAVLGQVYGLSHCHLIITLQPPSNLNGSQHLFLEACFFSSVFLMRSKVSGIVPMAFLFLASMS